jgi:hypothetical protein
VNDDLGFIQMPPEEPDKPPKKGGKPKTVKATEPPKAATPNGHELMATASRAFGWDRPPYDPTQGMSPLPDVWTPQWHRELGDEDKREIASLKKAIKWATDDLRRIARGTRRSMAFGGPPGIGKSTIAKQVMAEEGYVEGYIAGEKFYIPQTGRITGRDSFILFLRHPDAVFVFDDAEDMTTDKQAIVILRQATEMTHRRHLYWRTGAAPRVKPSDTGLSDRELEEYRDENGDLPAMIQVRHFEFRGRIVIITNDDLLAAAKKDRQHTRKSGIAALVDRLQPIDIGHRDRHIALLRLEQLCAEEALGWRKGLSFAEEGELLDEFRKSSAKFHNISIRTFIDAADLRREYPDDWRDRLARYFDSEMKKGRK